MDRVTLLLAHPHNTATAILKKIKSLLVLTCLVLYQTVCQNNDRLRRQPRSRRVKCTVPSANITTADCLLTREIMQRVIAKVGACTDVAHGQFNYH